MANRIVLRDADPPRPKDSISLEILFLAWPELRTLHEEFVARPGYNPGFTPDEILADLMSDFS